MAIRSNIFSFLKSIYTGHSIQRIFERGTEPEKIENSLDKGEMIEEYPGDDLIRVYFYLTT